MPNVCSKCGHALPQATSFCRYCGTPAPKNVSPPSPAPATAVSTGPACTKCGAALPQNARFCRYCGTLAAKDTGFPSTAPAATVSAGPVCSQCGASLPENARFCRQCGIPREAGTVGNPKIKPLTQKESRAISKPPVKPPGQGVDRQPPSPPPGVPGAGTMQSPAKTLPAAGAIKQTVQEAKQLFAGVAAPARGVLNFDYTPLPGLGGIGEAATSITEAIGPFKVLLEGLSQLPRNIAGALGDKNKLTFALVFAAIWLAFTLLPALDITFPAGSFLSWLTFAQGGLQGGIPGFLGGVFGKGLFVSVVIGLFTPRESRRKAADLIKEKVSLPFGQGDIGFAIMGAGIALFGYNLMTGDNSLQNSMIGIVAAVGTLRAMHARSGFLRRLLTACLQKFSRGRSPGNISLNRLMAGMTAGFGAAVPLSALNVPWLGYALGILALAAGTAVSLTARPAHGEGMIE